MGLVTIFTPTYNRVPLLSKLYESLCQQSDKDFVWYIVDDGSDDDTSHFVSLWKKTAPFQIIYRYQINSGKHIAYNLALQECNTEWFVCIDSDDVLLNNGVALMKEYASKIHGDLAGIIFPRQLNGHRSYSLSRIIDGPIDIMDLKYKYNFNGETSILFKTQIAKQYLFPYFHGEKFMSEEIVYINMSKKYKFLYINYPLCSYEYHSDGLTKNLYINWANNYYSTNLLLNMRYLYLSKYKFSVRIENRLKTIINHSAVSFKAKINPIEHSPSKLLTIVLFIPSIIFYFSKYHR
ncbi:MULTISPECIES: glycosyltransferase family 2 protein [Bifidobacterium]|uniref:glycosyltransferase family 2 protein n=1 Tax=Bifidobacterium TaxID=1678 RepID=UPI001BDC2097|nr:MULTISPECIES: glycosyltransferase family 2 protein [Bifidobacterium]MBT1161019.1 glycosyltransferase family 2 protein [Bifidobacterium sp. SO1]MBW3079549.1 glycosyltransferase family 2 protein [Bifidobacterium simiiventris]